MAGVDERVVDITRCSLCNETSLEPKRLPCFHVFCIDCLQTTASTSETRLKKKISCPVCETDCSLPSAGFGGLHTDSFIQRLTEVNDIINLSSNSLVCNACQEENDTDTGHEVSSAHMYCAKCCMRLCNNCCRVHKKSELTRDHTFVNLINETISRELMEQLEPNSCVNHTEEKLKLYCSDCKSVVCALCFMESHQNHRWTELEKVANESRKQIQNNASCLSRCDQDILNKLQLLQKEKSDIIRRTGEVKSLVDTAKSRLKRLVDTHAHILLEQIESLKDSKLDDVETDYEDLTRKMSTLKSYLSYAEELEGKGSPGDFCRVVNNFVEKLAEVENFTKSRQSRQVTQFTIDFKKSKLEDFLTTCGGNSVGKVFVDKDVKTQSQARECSLEDILSKPEKLQQELSEDKIIIRSLKSAIEEQKKDTFEEVMKTTTLQTMIDELKRKLDKETQFNITLQKIIEKQKQEVDREKVVQISLQTRLKKSQKELEVCRLKIEEIQQFHTEQLKERKVAQDKQKIELAANAELLETKVNEKDQYLAVKEKMIETLNEKAEHLEQLLELAKRKNDSTVTKMQGLHGRNQTPVLSHIISRPPTGSNSVMGLTVLGNDLFLISGSNSEIEIFDSTTFSFKHKVAVKGLTNPQDIVSCPRYECLYIMDLQRIKYVMRLETNGNLIRKWSTGNDGGRLSVTKKSTLIVTFYYSSQLREYTPEGEMLHQVKFSMNSGIVHPWHAVELNNGHFVVCFGCCTDIENKICIVDRKGNVLLSFGGKRGSQFGQLHFPAYLAVDDAGNIIVADQNNSRLLLLSPQLTFIRELLSIRVKGVTRRLSKFYLDECKGKLFLTDNEWDLNVRPGKVLVFDLD